MNPRKNTKSEQGAEVRTTPTHWRCATDGKAQVLVCGNENIYGKKVHTGPSQGFPRLVEYGRNKVIRREGEGHRGEHINVGDC